MPEMKDSGVEWIGEIPLDWGTSKMRYIGQYINGYAFKPDDWSSEGKRIIRIQDLTGTNNNPNYYAGQLPDKYNVTAGDILVSWAATLDAFIWNNEDAWLNQHIFKAICFPKVMDKNFFFWVLKEAMENMNNDNKHGIVMQHITLSVFSNFTIPLPPKLVQRRIANYLDRKCAEIDAIIAKQQQIIEKLKEYKLSVITEAVTKGLDPNVPMKDSGVEWIGKIPEHWVTGKIKNFCNLKTGSTPSTSNTEWFDGMIRWFTPGDFVETFILKDSARTLSQKAKDDMVAVIVPPNTVMIVGIGATAGKIGYTMVECSCNQQITAINTNKIMPKYLMYWMIANTKFLRDTAMFTTLPILNNQTIGNYLVMFPDDRNEEKEVVDYLDGKCDKIEILIEAKKHEIDRLHRYKKSIIYEIVTGKMEV